MTDHAGQLFVARQPILDRRKEVYGYELLFRSSPENFFPMVDGDVASTRVVHDSLLEFGLDHLVGPGRAFINFTRKMVVEEFYQLIPAERVVVELLEDVEPDEEVIEACRTLKQAGYLLALDDFRFEPKMRPLMEMADVIKVDFQISDTREREMLGAFGKKSGVSILAEKVETWEEYALAVDWGYTYFQGYFFCKPEMMQTQAIPAFKHALLQFLQLLNAETLDFDRLEATIKQDVSISVKLLRYLNSALFSLRNKVESIKQALVLLGETAIRKWGSVVALAGLGQDKPLELMVTSLVRARFCELVGAEAGMKGRELDLFLLGMFSVLDALMNQPIDVALHELAIADDVRAALIGEDSGLTPLFDLVFAWEHADWDLVKSSCAALQVEERRVLEIYDEAVLWARDVSKLSAG